MDLLLNHLPNVIDLAESITFLLATLGLVLVAVNSRSQTTMSGNEDRRTNRKRLKGGHIWTEILEGMKDRQWRMIDRIMKRLPAATSEGEREMLAEMMTIFRKEIDDIAQLIDMKDPDSGEPD